MKILKKIIISLSVMLLVGGACFAQQQEEFQRDSVWGLEWSLQDSILTVSFMSSCDGYTGILLESYKGGVYNENLYYDMFSYMNEDGNYWGDVNKTMDFVSLMIDTLSTRLTRYTLSVKLAAVYFIIPQDVSSYCGYFGVSFIAPNHEYISTYIAKYYSDLTQCSQFLYFNLLGTLTWNEDYGNDQTLYAEEYYTMAGVPLKEMPVDKPIVVLMKNADNRIVNSKVCVWRP
ncbi:MAG: hypothetical protein IK017_00515 [Paludibacteraceae bacterium]|nr:hypothetical protein [Paludibacteraceae bacterium]